MSVAGVLAGQAPAAPYRFEVVVDGVPLGSFTACEGLNAEYEMKEVMEGGVNGYIQRLPGRLKHANVKLSRPLDGTSSNQESLAAWFSRIGRGQGRTQVLRTVGITAYTSGGLPVARWALHGAIPIRWTGPSFASDGSGVAKETLEFAHQGFM